MFIKQISLVAYERKYVKLARFISLKEKHSPDSLDPEFVQHSHLCSFKYCFFLRGYYPLHTFFETCRNM